MGATTRLFALGALSLFMLMMVHNILNLELAESHRPRSGGFAAGLRPQAGRAGVDSHGFALDDDTPGARAEQMDTTRAAVVALSTAGPVVRPAPAADEDPWTARVVPWSPTPFNFTDCTARPGTMGPTRPLEYIVDPADAAGFPANCDREDLSDLCEVVRKVAINREVLTAVCNSKIIGQLENFLNAVDAAGITNVIIIALDQKLVDWLDKRGVAYYKKISAAAGSHKISAQKFRIVREFLEVGCSVLMSDIDIVWIRNPFAGFMWRDTDLEGATDGWDNETAYGWTEHLEDVTLGRSREMESYRITAFNSGLWYLQATRGGLRMMQLLAHRMETEDTWDQTAFSQEASLPTHDDWLSAGITVRVMNHMCFCNSKTLLRGIRPAPELQAHRPVVVHVNYHQNKEQHMIDIKNRYHKGDLSALDNTARREPRALRRIAEVEAPFWTELNDGFVSGAHVQPSVKAVTQSRCRPMSPANAFLKRAPARVAPACDDDAAPEMRALCDKVSELARGGDLALVVATPGNAATLPLFAEAARTAGVADRVLVLANDVGAEGAAGTPPSQAAQAAGLAAMALDQALPAEALSALSALPAAALKYAALRQVLKTGTSVLLVEPSVVLLSDPFLAVYRDSDIEAMPAGWDDPSAYGYNHVLDDPTMGFTRFCHGSRIVAKDPSLLFAAASEGAVRFASVIVRRLRQQQGSPAPKSEREIVSEELWLPSSPAVARAGAVSRVLDYLCFPTPKVLWRTINRVPALRSGHTPVAVSINQGSEAAQRMRAVMDRYHKGSAGALDALPVGEAMPDFSPEVCDTARNLRPAAGAAASSAWLQQVTAQPWTWSGVKEIAFEADGTLKTPWGQGTWSVVPNKERMVSATFIGRQHILLFRESGRGHAQFISQRCDDADVVMGRPLVAAGGA